MVLRSRLESSRFVHKNYDVTGDVDADVNIRTRTGSFTKTRRSLRVHARRRNEFCTAKNSHADVFSDAFFVAQKIRANPEILA